MKLFKTLKQPLKKIDTKMSFFLLTCIGLIVIVCYCLNKNREPFTQLDKNNIWLEDNYKGKYNTGGEYCGTDTHYAQTCSLCPYDKNGKYIGKDLCNGSCKWDNNENKCVMKKILNYNGYISKTASGRTCQVWNEDFPHKKPTDDGILYNIGNHNYCRTPGNKNAWTPWCFTTDPKQRWERCNIDDEPAINNIIANARAKGRESGLIQGKKSGRIKGKEIGIKEGERRGLAKGRAEGHAKGIVKGRKEGKSTAIEKIRNKIMNDEIVFNYKSNV